MLLNLGCKHLYESLLKPCECGGNETNERS